MISNSTSLSEDISLCCFGNVTSLCQICALRKKKLQWCATQARPTKQAPLLSIFIFLLLLWDVHLPVFSSSPLFCAIFPNHTSLLSLFLIFLRLSLDIAASSSPSITSLELLLICGRLLCTLAAPNGSETTQM